MDVILCIITYILRVPHPCLAQATLRIDPDHLNDAIALVPFSGSPSYLRCRYHLLSAWTTTSFSNGNGRCSELHRCRSIQPHSSQPPAGSQPIHNSVQHPAPEWWHAGSVDSSGRIIPWIFRRNVGREPSL